MTLATAVLLAGQLLPRPPEVGPAGDEEEDAAAVLKIEENDAADSTPAISSIFFECMLFWSEETAQFRKRPPIFCNHLWAVTYVERRLFINYAWSLQRVLLSCMLHKLLSLFYNNFVPFDFFMVLLGNMRADTELSCRR